MNFQDSISEIIKYSQTNSKSFWIGLIILILLLFFIFKGKKYGDNSSSIGMNPFELEVFKRKNK